MKIYMVKSLRDFIFWSGAIDTVKYLTSRELDTIESILEECYPDGMNETTINNFFWFKKDTIAKWLSHSSFDELTENREEK